MGHDCAHSLQAIRQLPRLRMCSITTAIPHYLGWGTGAPEVGVSHPPLPGSHHCLQPSFTHRHVHTTYGRIFHTTHQSWPEATDHSPLKLTATLNSGHNPIRPWSWYLACLPHNRNQWYFTGEAPSSGLYFLAFLVARVTNNTSASRRVGLGKACFKRGRWHVPLLPFPPSSWFLSRTQMWRVGGATAAILGTKQIVKTQAKWQVPITSCFWVFTTCKNEYA